MRDLRRWIPVGLAAAVVSVAAIGYGMIATGVATPLGGSLGSVPAPEVPGAVPLYLADGRPAFVVSMTDAVHVLDARVPIERGAPGRLVGWCGEADGVLLDPIGGGAFGPDGRLIGGPGSTGLLVYPIGSSDGGRTIRVEQDAVAAGTSTDPAVALDCPPGTRWVVHQPDPDEVFDPSVAADEEPPGWIWLEGRLEAVGGQALVCDGVEARDCATGAVVPGIDPARLAALPEPLAGYFIGRVGDGVIEELHHVPATVGGS